MTTTLEAALNVSRAIAAGEIGTRGAELLTEDFRYHGAMHMEMDRDAYVGFMSALADAFSSMDMQFGPTLTEGELAAVHFRNDFVHTGEYQGVPATGNAMFTTGTFIRRIEDGRVAEEWDNTDLMVLAQQLGMLGG